MTIESPHQNISCNKSTTHNPYKRLPCRRAIACVLCAKAKTKCDKKLPSCSRCITKGLKCDPRSTRRTSDNSYRSIVKKPFVSPKRYHSTSKIPTTSSHSSPRIFGSSMIHGASSHFDFRTPTKMNHQASVCAGYPTLTPLPTFASQTSDTCYAYPIYSETNFNNMTPILEPNAFPISGRLSPQTPESLAYHEPVSIHEVSDPWEVSQAWGNAAMGTMGLEFDADVTIGTTLPMQLWSTPDHSIDWHQCSLSASPQVMSHELVPDVRVVPSLSISECSVADFSSASNFQENWAHCQPITTQLEMEDMVAPSPFVQGLGPNPTPVWEDVFGPALY